MVAIEGTEHKSFGGSLPIPSVKEMVRQAITTIPQIYVINHGINASLLGKMGSEAEDIFNLSVEDKKKLWQKQGDLEGFGQMFLVSEYQKLDWADMFYLINFPAKTRNHHFYENLPDSFREAFESYAEEVQEVAMSLLGSIGRALKIAEEEMITLFDDGFQGVRINYYPQCPEPEKVMVIAPHSDPVALALLFEANEVHGLEVSKDGKWIPIKPIKNAFVVNVGDALEMISNGAYKSIMHRATVNCKQSRISIAAFHGPNYSKQARISIAAFHGSNYAIEVGPPKSLITVPENSPLFKRIKVESMFTNLFAKKLKEKSIVESLKVQSTGKWTPTSDSRSVYKKRIPLHYTKYLQVFWLIR